MPATAPGSGGGGSGDITQADLTAHAADTTAVHGIADTSVLETVSGSAAKVAALAATVATDAELAAHEADTTAVHGIASTAALVLTGDARLSDQRVPTDNSVTSAKIVDGAIVNADVNAAAAIAESKLSLATDAAAGTGSRRTLGTGALQAAAGNDARLSDQRVPVDGSVTSAKIADGAIVDVDVNAGAAIAESKLALASDAAAGTASRRTLGTGANQAAAGNHTHAGVYEPAGTVAAHEADTTAVHGIADTSLLETQSGAQTKANAAQAAAVATAAADVDAHEADTTNIHGIADTASLVLTGDARLSDARTPTPHAASHLAAGADPLAVSDFLRAGLASARPAAAAGLAGVIYFATDTLYLYRCDGSSWVEISSGGAFAWPAFGIGAGGLAGRYLSPPGPASGVLTAPGHGTLYAHPYVVPVRMTFDRFNFKTSGVAGEAGAVGRGVIWDYDQTVGWPGALVADVGTAAVDGALATKEISMSVTLDPGIYCLSVVQQAAPTTRANLVQMSGALAMPLQFGVAGGSRASDGATNYVGWINNTAAITSGAAPATFDRSGTDSAAIFERNTVPICKLRVAP